MLTKEDLLKPKTEIVKLKIGEVEIRHLTAGEMLEAENADPYELMSKLTSQPKLSKDELMKMPGDVFMEFQQKAMDLIGATKEAVEDIKKNSEATA